MEDDASVKHTAPSSLDLLRPIVFEFDGSSLRRRPLSFRTSSVRFSG